jgi:hypothetical protein
MIADLVDLDDLVEPSGLPDLAGVLAFVTAFTAVCPELPAGYRTKIVQSPAAPVRVGVWRARRWTSSPLPANT